MAYGGLGRGLPVNSASRPTTVHFWLRYLPCRYWRLFASSYTSQRCASGPAKPRRSGWSKLLSPASLALFSPCSSSVVGRLLTACADCSDSTEFGRGFSRSPSRGNLAGPSRERARNLAARNLSFLRRGDSDVWPRAFHGRRNDGSGHSGCNWIAGLARGLGSAGGFFGGAAHSRGA